MVHLNLTRDPEFKEAKKNVTVGEINSGPATNDRQRSGTPDPRPQSVYQRHVMVHGPQKKRAGIQSIFFLHPEVVWDQLVSLTHSQLQATCCKYFTR